ncbi:uncharacterized protein LOC121796833 [Salvia splendens]|uniref:uncharacterized protein LOC121796833 n=1 Tax=Salvia splendens TaxID=180675 RepID=UPI001C269935|nr:uncharacterized protein LOC121796833 [Salvia splendens]
MEKAYDRVQWLFLLKVLKRMGFSDKWVSLIENCISPCWFSMLVNGCPTGFFKSSQGLRQGDPISPSLFILAADYLSRLLDRFILGRKDMMYRTTRYTMGVSHLAYAAAILNLSECLKHYMEVSGQRVNVGKSCFFLDKKHHDWAEEIKEDRQKSYADVRRTDLQFEVGEKVFLKVSPSKGITRFGVKGKLRPRFIGPYEILDRVGAVAYRLALPPNFGNVHNVFHVSQLRKYVFDPTHIVHQEEMMVLNPDLSYEEKPEAILDRRVQELRNKSIVSVKVRWRNHGVEEATWELEDKMREKFPELFE